MADKIEEVLLVIKYKRDYGAKTNNSQFIYGLSNIFIIFYKPLSKHSCTNTYAF
ncbi:hypothetical protein CDOMC_0091 [Campylobacter sp. RM16192]|nr:hypothetical protein CDOMC_0091 [Campylobacter sp. RM16192]